MVRDQCLTFATIPTFYFLISNYQKEENFLFFMAEMHLK